ncbi:hypothetical protein HYS47_00885 [Candidatus Woesearchaeota archaeon]|nr:hypothetical protein [Candidatus Woesearchaeota archaeon]
MGSLSSTLVHDKYYVVGEVGEAVQKVLSQRHQHIDVMFQIAGAESDRPRAYAATELFFWHEDYASSGKGSRTPALAIGRFSLEQTHALLDAAAYLQGAQQSTGVVGDDAFRHARHELPSSTLALVGGVLDAYRVVSYRAEHDAR